MTLDNLRDTGITCRFCTARLKHAFVDLGMSPPCETVLTVEQLNHMERFYPLHAYVCDKCFLVQLGEYVTPHEIFSEYAYFSSNIDALVNQARAYADMMVARFKLDSRSRIVEIGSNDGYLLQFFAQKNFSVLGVEPAANVAQVAIERGIPTIVEFFGQDVARKLLTQGDAADVLVGNNVLAQVPNLNDFVEGLRNLLKPRGVITIDFPHLLRLIDDNQFDTIYHEHFSYFSFTTVEKIFAAHGLTLFDVEELSTHGGSLRIFARHADDSTKPVSRSVQELRTQEQFWGVWKLETYYGFAEKVSATKREILKFLINAKEADKSIAGYGAPGKATTLLNFCGIRTDFLEYTVDRNPYKQGKFIAGTHIPIFHPDRIRETRPDYLFILPWNLKDEIAQQNKFIRGWGGKFVVPIPRVEVF